MTNATSPAPAPRIDRAAAEAEVDLLRRVTSLPTASGREGAVVAFIEAWLAARPGLRSRRDAHGNIEVSLADAPSRAPAGGPPVYFTAHLDHPAFVVDRMVAPGVVEIAFRGGVMDEYFVGTPVRIYPGSSASRGASAASPTTTAVRAVITGAGDATTPFKTWLAEIDESSPASAAASVAPGDLAVWHLPAAEVSPDEDLPAGGRGGVLHAPACDDLAAVAAALAAMDRLLAARARGAAVLDARLLFTLAEEIGFIGAIGAARDRFMPADARIIALENSRSFPADSPIGGGPIVRVGDRVSTFSPGLTAAVAKVCEDLSGGSAHPLAIEKHRGPNWRWQRKLMPGGACEASVFCHYNHEATCVCLPLGNYHNMANLAEMQARAPGAEPRIAREFIAVDDYLGMVDVLAACGENLPQAGSFRARVEELWSERRYVLA